MLLVLLLGWLVVSKLGAQQHRARLMGHPFKIDVVMLIVVQPA